MPDDYGETDIWIEPELTNDHRYLYIHGKSNLLQGTEIKGAYYAHPDDILPQESGLPYRTYVEPDGTFLLRVGYESLTNEGILKIFSRPDTESHDPKQLIHEAYQLLMNCGIGYMLVQMSPLFLKLLVGVASAV